MAVVKADLIAFKMFSGVAITPKNGPSLNFNELILAATNRTMPKTSTNAKSKRKHWYSNDQRKYIKKRKMTGADLIIVNKTISSDANLSQVRIFTARAPQLKLFKRRCCR